MSSGGTFYDRMSWYPRVKDAFGNTSGTSVSFFASTPGTGKGHQLLRLLGPDLTYPLGKQAPSPLSILMIISGMRLFSIRQRKEFQVALVISGSDWLFQFLHPPLSSLNCHRKTLIGQEFSRLWGWCLICLSSRSDHTFLLSSSLEDPRQTLTVGDVTHWPDPGS